MDLLFVFSGFAVGAIVGLTGVGGGSPMTPLLVLVFGVHPATAVGTDLLYAAVTKFGGTISHARQRHVDWRVSGLLAAGSIPAAALTVLALSQLPRQSPAFSQTISVGLGIALLLTAAAIAFGRRLQAAAQRGQPVSCRTRTISTISVGAVLGVLVSISSVGAGALGVAALYFLYPHLASKQVVGSDVAHAVPLTLVAGLGHWWLGSIDWALLGSLLVGSLPGIWLGSQLSAKVPEQLLRRLLALMLVLVGAKLISA